MGGTGAGLTSWKLLLQAEEAVTMLAGADAEALPTTISTDPTDLTGIASALSETGIPSEASCRSVLHTTSVGRSFSNKTLGRHRC